METWHFLRFYLVESPLTRYNFACKADGEVA